MMPTPDFAVPYEAPKQAKTMAEVQPRAEKNGCGFLLSVACIERKRQ